MNLLGTRAQADLTREGRAGRGHRRDLRHVVERRQSQRPVRHNIVGLLTEAARVAWPRRSSVGATSCASPTGAKEYAPSKRLPLPWPGGWWRIADIVGYELGFARSLLGSLAREPRYWLGNQLQAAERAVRGEVRARPRPGSCRARTPTSARRCAWRDVLLAGGVEIQSVQQAFVCDGRSWPAGSLFISAHQPYMRHVKDLFDTQSYPPAIRPTTWRAGRCRRCWASRRPSCAPIRRRRRSFSSA
jgi:hypothetical protein